MHPTCTVPIDSQLGTHGSRAHHGVPASGHFGSRRSREYAQRSQWRPAQEDPCRADRLVGLVGDLAACCALQEASEISNSVLQVLWACVGGWSSTAPATCTHSAGDCNGWSRAHTSTLAALDNNEDARALATGWESTNRASLRTCCSPSLGCRVAIISTGKVTIIDREAGKAVSSSATIFRAAVQSGWISLIDDR